MSIKERFSLSAEAFKIKPEVACYLVTWHISSKTTTLSYLLSGDVICSQVLSKIDNPFIFDYGIDDPALNIAETPRASEKTKIKKKLRFCLYQVKAILKHKTSVGLSSAWWTTLFWKQNTVFSQCMTSALFLGNMLRARYYYMEESVLLGTKPLVDSIRHFIRDPVAYFPCHLCECRIVQWRHDSRLLLLLNI